MDENKYFPITIKKELEDVSEVPNLPRKILQNPLLNQILTSEVHDATKLQLFENEKKLSTVEIPSNNSTHLSWPRVPSICAIEQPSSERSANMQKSSAKIPTFSSAQQSSSKISAVSARQKSSAKMPTVSSMQMLLPETPSNLSSTRLISPRFLSSIQKTLPQVPSASSARIASPQIQATLILSNNKPPQVLVRTPGLQKSLLKINSPLPCSFREVQPTQKLCSIAPMTSLTPNLNSTGPNVSVPLPVADKVVKPKKRSRKRYVFSKPKKRSKKKQDLPSTLSPLNEPSLELFNKNSCEEFDSDGSADTIIADEISNNASVGKTSEKIKEQDIRTTVAQTINPPVLGRLLITGGTVINLPAVESGIAEQISIPDVKTSGGKMVGPENISLVDVVKKEMEESPIAVSLPPVLNNDEMEITKEVQPALMDVELPKSGRKQTARRGKSKQKLSRQSNIKKKPANLTDNFAEVNNASSENPFEAAVTNTPMNPPLLDTSLQEKPQSKKDIAKRKSPRKNWQDETPANINVVLPTAASNESLALTESPGKAKRTKAAAKKNNTKFIPSQEDVLNLHRKYDKVIDQVVSSSLALSLKEEQCVDDCQDASSTAKSSSFAPKTDSFSETSTPTTKLADTMKEKLYVSLAFEEDESNKDDTEDKLSLLMAFRQLNSKGQFVKSPDTSANSTHSTEQTDVGSAPTTLANELQTSTLITKALPLSYLTNFEISKQSNSDSPMTDTIKMSSATQVQGGGFPLNIKKEIVEATEGPSTDNRTSAVEDTPKEPVRHQSPVQPSINDSLRVPAAERKQTARRGKKRTPAAQSLLPSNEPTPEVQNPAIGDSNLASIQPPQTVSRMQTARRGRGKGKTKQAKNKAADNLAEKSLEVLSRLEPTATLQKQQEDPVLVSTSTASDSQVQSTVLPQKQDGAKINIKTEPEEYEIITLDDSPIKKPPANNCDNSSFGSGYLSHDNCNIVAASIKKELPTELEKNLAVTDRQENPIPLGLTKLTLIDSGSTRTSPIPASLSSVSEVANQITAPDELIPTVDSNTNYVGCESSSREKSTPPETVPFIKKEMEDFHVVQPIPENSLFVNCLNSANEPQITANNLPMHSTPIVDQTEDSFQSSDNNKTSITTLEEVWNQPGPSTDAVYSSTITKGLAEGWNKPGTSTEAVYSITTIDTSRHDDYDDPMEREFHQSSTYHDSRYQNTYVRGHSPQDAVAFAGVSTESLKNIIGNVDILSESGTKDTSLSLLDDEDTSSQTSSFYSRSSPRLSTPLSDSVSLRLSDSVSPLTSVPSIPCHAQNVEDPRSSSRNGSNDSSLKETLKPILPNDVPGDETDEMKSLVALKLRLAASLPQYCIVHDGDLVPLENYSVGDGEVECFHKLLLATSSSNLTPKLESPVMASPAIETVIPDSITEESSTNIDLNRTAVLDQFIMSKIVEERDQMTLGEYKTQSIIDLIEQAKHDVGLKSNVYTRGANSYSDLSLEQYAVRRRNLSFSSEEGPETSDRREKTFNTTVKFDNYMPLLSEAPLPNNSKLNSDPISKVAEENFNTLPANLGNKQPEFDLSLLPDMLKIITNLKESSSTTTTTTNPLHDPPSKVGNKQNETANRKVNDSIGQNVPSTSTPSTNRSKSSKNEGRSQPNTKFIPSIISPPSTKRSKSRSSSRPRTKLIPSIISPPSTKRSKSRSTSSPQKKLIPSTLSPPPNRNLINISLPSNDLLYNVIQNTQLSEKDGLGSSLPGKSIVNKNLNESFVVRDILKLPRAFPETSSYLHETSGSAESASLSNFKAINSRKDIAVLETQVETVDNLTVLRPPETFSAKPFANPAETQPEVCLYSKSAFSNADMGESVGQPSITEPAKSISIADKIDVAELLKILNTAKSMQSNVATPPSEVFQHFDKTYPSEQSVFQNSPHDYQTSNYDDNRYAYEDKYMRQHPSYTDDYMTIKTPIVMDYDHKPPPSDPRLQLATVFSGSNETENISSLPSQANEPDESGSDVDNEFIGNESDPAEESVPEEPIIEDNSVKESPKKKIEDSQNFPQYKSRWEKIMERKSQTYEDLCSAKVPQSKAKIQKPIAHVQPCNQSSLKRKTTENKVSSGRTGKRAAVETENVQRKKSKNSELPSSLQENEKGGDNSDSSLLREKKKMRKVEDTPGKNRLDKKNKSNVNKTKTHKSNSSHNLSPKKKSLPPTVDSSVAKKSKSDKTINKKHHTKPRHVLLEDPSTLFIPDKIIKRKEVKYSGSPPKVDDEASKRLYGRVTNRGGFLTESSKKQTPKSKALLEKKSTEKPKTSNYFSEEFHSLISTPEIQITPKSDLLQKHSNKLSLESYKRKRGIFSELSTGIESPKVNFHRDADLNTLRPTSSSTGFSSCASPDISHQASSDSSEFYSPPPDPFDSNVPSPALPSFEANKLTFNRALLPTPDAIPMTTKHSTYVKRPLLPDPVPRNNPRQPSRESLGNTQFDNLLFSNSPVQASSSPLIQQSAVPSVSLVQQPIVPPVPLVQQQIIPLVSGRNRHSRPRATTCICLPPKTLKASVGSKVFETFDVMLLILEWNVDWLFQQQKNLEPPPISNSVKKIANTYVDFEDYYNTYLPLLLLETWQRIYESWTHLNQAPPYFCEITSYAVETHTIKVQCQAVFRSSDAKKGLLPEEGNIIMVKFGTKEKGGIKILGYVTDVKITAFDPSNQSQNTCYRSLKYTASDMLQLLTLTFLGAYNSEDFDKNQLIRIQVLCNIKPTLKQNDALLGINKSPLYRSILNPMNDGLRIVNMPSRNPDPLKVSETLNECVRDIITGIISSHQVPILTIAKTVPSSDKMSVFLPLVEKMKHSYKTKVLLCTRTAKALTDIGCHLEGGTVKVVITSKRADTHHKLRKYHLEDLAVEKATSNLDSPPIPGFQKIASKQAIEGAKAEIIRDCDVILSNIRGCHTEFLEQACADEYGLSQMCCIIDEANLCTEPEILIPLLYGISKLILIGDPDERAKVCSKTVVHYDYDRSLFHRANDLDLASE